MNPWSALHEFATAWYARLDSPNFQWSELQPSDITAENMGVPYCKTHADQFRKNIGSAAQDCYALAAILDRINDILGLASAVYDRWQDLWQCSPVSSPSEKDREWFRLAFRQLALLSGSNEYPFVGFPQTLQLTSYLGCFFVRPAPDKEVKQSLSISANGRAQFSGYTSADLNHPCRHFSFSIAQNKAQDILTAAVRYCNQCFDPNDIVFDAGGWNMVLSSEEGNRYRFCGHLFGRTKPEESSFSERLRYAMGMSDLFGIDGNARSYSKLRRITLHCEEIAHRQDEDVPEYERSQSQLMIDRTFKTIEVTLSHEDNSKAFFRWEHPVSVCALLDDVSDPLFFQVNDVAAEDVV